LKTDFEVMIDSVNTLTEIDPLSTSWAADTDKICKEKFYKTPFYPTVQVYSTEVSFYTTQELCAAFIDVFSTIWN